MSRSSAPAGEGVRRGCRDTPAPSLTGLPIAMPPASTSPALQAPFRRRLRGEGFPGPPPQALSSQSPRNGGDGGMEKHLQAGFPRFPLQRKALKENFPEAFSIPANLITFLRQHPTLSCHSEIQFLLQKN